MKTIFLAILGVLSLSVVNVNAQVCGGGHRTYHIFVRDGMNTINPRYELFAVMPTGLKDDFETTAKYLSKTFFPNQEERPFRFWSREPLSITAEVAEKFLKGYDSSKYKKDPDERWFRENKYSGEIKFASLIFNTSELYDRPILLKIFADNYKPVYLLGAHFGGCSKQFDVLLDDFIFESERPIKTPPKR